MSVEDLNEIIKEIDAMIKELEMGDEVLLDPQNLAMAPA